MLSLSRLFTSAFIEGVARIVDPFGVTSTHRWSGNTLEDDFCALYSDVSAVGQDMRHAFHAYDEERRNAPYE